MSLLQQKNIHKIKINWEGSLFVHHSLGMVNRELLTELLHSSLFDIRYIPFEPDQFTPSPQSKYAVLQKVSQTPHPDADIHVRHRFPPDLSKPPSGKFILMQPWEFGSLPVAWCKAMSSVVDEIWVCSRFLKLCYEKSGVPREKIVVVPNGIDPMLFTPDALKASWVREAAAGRYCFLYNGGITTRKGTDLLINAYLSEFRVDEQVCLVIKDSVVYPKGMAVRVKALSDQTDIAKIIYSGQSMAHEDLAGLYTACDCYVHPYRAEGYGLPIAEAMACGKPVIVTGGGACLDFVEPDKGYFVKCTLEQIPEKKIGNFVTVDYPFWLQPDMDHLRSVLRYVFNNREKAAKRGREASDGIRMHHRWQDAAGIAMKRLEALCSATTNQFPVKPTTAPEIAAREIALTHAIALLRKGAYEDAILELQKILLRYGECCVTYEGLGIASFYKGNYQEACNLFAAANKLGPDTIDILLNWYEAAKFAHREEEMHIPVHRALQQYPENDELRAIGLAIGVFG